MGVISGNYKKFDLTEKQKCDLSSGAKSFAFHSLKIRTPYSRQTMRNTVCCQQIHPSSSLWKTEEPKKHIRHITIIEYFFHWFFFPFFSSCYVNFFPTDGTSWPLMWTQCRVMCCLYLTRTHMPTTWKPYCEQKTLLCSSTWFLLRSSSKTLR